MGMLILTLIAGALAVFDIITVDLFMTLVIGSIIWAIIGMTLYFKFGFLKFFYHDFLGWHTPDDSPQWFDGCSEHTVCKHCGRDIMQDSQGNWFVGEDYA